MTENKLGLLDNNLAKMRLMIEGAISIYENHQQELYARAIREGRVDEAVSINTLGKALYSLHELIENNQQAIMESICFDTKSKGENA